MEPAPTIQQAARISAANVSDELRACFARRGYTQQDAARFIGISHKTLSRKLNGHVPLTVEELCGLCTYLGTLPSEILRMAELAAHV